MSHLITSGILRARIGSVSHGTMREEDLIPAFIDELDDIKDELSTSGDASEHVKSAIERIDATLAGIEMAMYLEDGEENPDYYGSEDAMYHIQDLFDLLDEFAPPYFYFGSHPGDGADYGWWLSESFEDECRDDCDIILMNAGDEWPEDEIRDQMESGVCPSYILSVNERGNCTLYTAAIKEEDRKEIWSIV